MTEECENSTVIGGKKNFRFLEERCIIREEGSSIPSLW